MASKRASIPAATVPLMLEDGTVNPVWYQWLSQSGESNSTLTDDPQDGYLYGSVGTTPTWLGFLQAGFGAIVRKWQDKVRDIVSVKDYGTDSSAFSNALSANSSVHVPAGSYSATANVPYDNLLWVNSGALITSISSQGSVIQENYNPNGLTWSGGPNGKANKSALYADIGGYGNPSFGGNGEGALGSGLTFSLMGSINIPSNSNQFFAGGVAGYSKTKSANSYAVGLFGQADMLVNSGLAWGINTATNDNGYPAAQVWGAEIDVNVSNVNSSCVGVDVIGGSTVEPNVAIAYRVGPLGTFTSPPKRWSQGLNIADGSVRAAIEIGASTLSGTNVGGPSIDFMKFNSSGNRAFGTKMYHGGLAFNIEMQDGADFLRLKTPTMIAFQAQGNAIGFYGTSLIGKQTVSGSKGGNAALAQLLVALNTLGLINDATS